MWGLKQYWQGGDYGDEDVKQLDIWDNGDDYHAKMKDRGDAEPYSNRNAIEGNRISGSGRPSTNPPTKKAESRQAIMTKKGRPLDSQAKLFSDSQEKPQSTLTSDSQLTQASTGLRRESEEKPPQASKDKHSGVFNDW